MDKGDLSYEALGPRKRLIDVAELERWSGGLKQPDKDQSSKDVSTGQTRTSSSDTTGRLEIENGSLKDKLATLEQERRRERELLQEQIEDLKLALRNANDQQTRLTALLTDQRQERDRKESQEQALFIKELRRRQIRLEHQLRDRDRGFFARWLGIGRSSKKTTSFASSPQESR